jgi:hypothetical protein
MREVKAILMLHIFCIIAAMMIMGSGCCRAARRVSAAQFILFKDCICSFGDGFPVPEALLT